MGRDIFASGLRYSLAAGHHLEDSADAALVRDCDYASAMHVKHGRVDGLLEDRMSRQYAESFFWEVAETIDIARKALGVQCPACPTKETVAEEFVYDLILRTHPEQRPAVVSHWRGFSDRLPKTALANVISSYTHQCSQHTSGYCSGCLPAMGAGQGLLQIECVGKPS
jgi:hypothetical protein